MKPLKFYKTLSTLKGRLAANAFIVEGERAVWQVVESHPDAVLEIVTVEGMRVPFKGYPRRALSESQFHSIAGTRTPQGVLAVVSLPWDTYSDSLPEDPGPRVLVLEAIQDPGNVGALIRTAAALNFSGVILSEKCADPFSPKCVQSTAGSVLSLWLRRGRACIDMVVRLREQGYFTLAADLDGEEDTAVIRGKEKLVLALGNEAAGLSQVLLDLSDYRLRLPTVREKAESLNVAACGAILMYLSAGL